MTKRSIYEALKLFPDEDLKKLCRKEKDGRMRIRLLALYHFQQGKSLSEVVDISLACEVSVRRWIFVYADKGYIGLLEEDGRGRYAKLGKDREQEFVDDVKQMQKDREGGRVIGKDVQLLLKEKYKINYALRSIYILLDRLGFSWISCRSKHPKTDDEAIETFKTDFPDIAEEIKQELGHNKIEIWWQDEMRVGQQGSLSRIWAPTGTRPRVVRQKQFLSTYIFGACCPSKDKACALILPVANTEMMQLHLNEISKQIEEDYHAIILLDRAGWHTTEQIQLPKNLTLVPLPPYSPELNSMEQLWQQLRKIKLSNICYKNYDSIVKSCAEAWNCFVEEDGAVRKLCSRKWAEIQS